MKWIPLKVMLNDISSNGWRLIGASSSKLSETLVIKSLIRKGGEKIGNDIIVMACFIYCMWKLTRGGCYSLRERILLAVSVYV